MSTDNHADNSSIAKLQEIINLSLPFPSIKPENTVIFTASK
jgi:hypothetical protein